MRRVQALLALVDAEERECLHARHAGAIQRRWRAHHATRAAARIQALARGRSGRAPVSTR